MQNSFGLTIAAPFSATPTQVELAPGVSAVVTVTFKPLAAGAVSTQLQFGDSLLEVDAEAFIEACATGCDDGDACTDDSCISGVCSHTTTTCTVSDSRCQVARCDRVRGCIAENVPDGTLTGPDNCRLEQVDLCLGGQNGARSRPASGRCSNRWQPATIPSRFHHAMAFDSARNRVVTFGGAGDIFEPDQDQTWEYDGDRWILRTPPMSPSARSGHVMAYDELRGRVVLFGGGADGAPGGETWEWDGSAWLHHHPAASPSARQYTSMAYDRARGRVVLFGGALQNETWEWDGLTWVQRFPALSPGARALPLMAFDAANNTVLLHGGVGSSEDWSWNGTSWAQLTSSAAPGVFTSPVMTEAQNSQVLLLGYSNNTYGAVGQTWQWSGSSWARAMTPSPELMGSVGRLRLRPARGTPARWRSTRRDNDW